MLVSLVDYMQNTKTIQAYRIKFISEFFHKSNKNKINQSEESDHTKSIGYYAVIY